MKEMKEMKKKKKKKKNIYIIVVIILGFIAGVVVDLLNFPSRIGIPIDSINWNVMHLAVNNSVVILIAVMTYFLIDKRSQEKDKNQQEVAPLFLEQTYKKCREFASLLDNEEFLKRAAEKCDFNKVSYEDKQMLHYLEAPFDYHTKIDNFACSGVISKKEFSDYIQVRDAFQKYIRIRIMCFDEPNLSLKSRQEFIEILEKAEEPLKKEE